MKDSIATTKDPVCGMIVNAKTSLHAERDGKTYYFCGEKCRQAFTSLPATSKPNGKSDGCC